MKFIEYWSILFFCTDAFFSAHNLETEILCLLLKAILRTLMIYILKSSNLNKLLFFLMFQNVRKKKNIYIYIFYCANLLTNLKSVSHSVVLDFLQSHGQEEPEGLL